MSVRHELADSRVSINGPLGNALVGFYHQRDSVGSNYVEGEPPGTPHDYSMSCVNSFTTAIKWHFTNNPGVFGYFPAVFSGIEGEGWTANDDLKLLKKLKGRMDQTQLDAGIAGAELGQAVDMLADRSRQMFDAYKAARRGDMKGLRDVFFSKPRRSPSPLLDSLNFGKVNRRDYEKRLLEAKKRNRQKLSDAQLEFQFGVRPLVDDVFNLADTIRGFAECTKRGTRVRASRKVAQRVVPSAQFPAVGTAFESKSIVAYLEQEESTLPERLGLANPLGILWEVMPWSFALDWIVPIGEFIDAQSFRLRAKGTFVTTFFSHYEATGGEFVEPEGNTTITFDSQVAPWFVNMTVVERTVTTQLSVPLPTLKSSLLGGEPLTRLANAWALLAGARRANLTNTSTLKGAVY